DGVRRAPPGARGACDGVSTAGSGARYRPVGKRGAARLRRAHRHRRGRTAVALRSVVDAPVVQPGRGLVQLAAQAARTVVDASRRAGRRRRARGWLRRTRSGAGTPLLTAAAASTAMWQLAGHESGAPVAAEAAPSVCRIQCTVFPARAGTRRLAMARRESTATGSPRPLRPPLPLPAAHAPRLRPGAR